MTMTASAVEIARSLHEGSFARLRPLVPEDSELTLRWRLSERAVQLNRGSTSVEQQRLWIRGRPATELNYIIETKNQIAVGMLSLINIELNHVGPRLPVFSWATSSQLVDCRSQLRR